MTVIQQVRKMQKTMLAEADALNDGEICEHIYDLFNYFETWEAIWTNQEFDNQETK